MKPRSLWFLGFLLGPQLLLAHSIDIQPVRIELKLEATQIRATIVCDAEFWNEGILFVRMSSPLPAAQWPAVYQDRAKAYVNQSFMLKMDGHPLTAGSFSPRYIEEPWHPESASVSFEVIYPIAALGQELSGRAQFFKSEYDLAQKHGDKVNTDQFVTHVKISGKKTVELQLPMAKPDFSVPIKGLEFTLQQQKMEKFKMILFNIASSPFFWIALIFLGVRLSARFFKRREE